MDISFDNKETEDLFREMSLKTEGLGVRSLGGCVISLMRWQSPPGGGWTIRIGLDFFPKSFLFREEGPDGKRGILGGIIFHRGYVRGEDGKSVPSDDPDDGYYEIHT